ncbi:MAG: TonB-dependent siderophore receptor [Steroidobacteraceae bacterium]
MSSKRNINKVLLPIVVASVAATTAAQTPAPAADGLEEVKVTALRQPFRGNVPLEELPQAVKILDSELLQTIGVTKLDDVLDLASGIARQNTFGGLWDAFAIRGFAGDENTPTGYLVNGFSNGRGFSGRRDSSNIERVEVLKGPGSALFGRGEPGGTINIVTKKPQFDHEGSLEVAAGRFDTYRVAGDYTGPISNSLAFRINGAWEDSNGFRDGVTFEKLSVTLLLWRIGDATVVNYELEIVQQEAPFDRGVVAPGGILGSVPITRFLGEPGDGVTEVDATGHQLYVQHEFNNDWSLLVGAGFRESEFTGFSSDPELVGGRQPFYATGTTLSRQRRFRDYKTEDVSVRGELSGRVEAGTLTHNLLMGVDYYNFEQDQVQTRFRPTLANPYAINVFAPVYGQTRTPGPFVNSLEEQEAFGVYLQDQIDLSEQWKVLVGLRYDDFEQTITNRASNVAVTQSDTATSPRLGVVYEATDNASFYASYSKGFRPNSGFDFAGVSFEPEFSKSYEIGAKLSSADKRLNATIAIYQGDKSNILTADPINAGFSISAGEARSRGLEFDFTGELAEDLNLNLSYAYTDAKVTKSALDPNFGLSLPAGSRLINIPRNQVNALLVQGFNWGTAKLTAGVGITHISERLGETGVPSFVLPAYTLVNLLGSWSPNEKLKISVDVDNLFDEEYYASSYARLWVAPGMPRSYTVRAQLKF